MAVTAVVLSATAGALVGAYWSSGSLVAASTPEPEPTSTGGQNMTGEVNYSFYPSCNNYEQMNGKHRRDCLASVNLESISANISHVEVTAVTMFGDSESWILYETPWPLLITEVDDGNTTTELWLGDVVIVEAVYTNGDRRILENHEFSCADKMIGDCPYDQVGKNA